MARPSRSTRTIYSRIRWAFWLCLALVIAVGGGFYLLSHDLRLSRVAGGKAKATSR